MQVVHVKLLRLSGQFFVKEYFNFHCLVIILVNCRKELLSSCKLNHRWNDSKLNQTILFSSRQRVFFFRHAVTWQPIGDKDLISVIKREPVFSRSSDHLTRQGLFIGL